MATNTDPRVMCQVCKREFPSTEVIPAALIRPTVVEDIRAAQPHWDAEGYVCFGDLHHFRGEHLRRILERGRGELSELDEEVVRTIREHDLVTNADSLMLEQRLSLGQHLADRVASFGGSWTFVILFLLMVAGWMTVNSLALYAGRFDPYPYILLNLVLSCVAALQAPIIMMSQNRQEAKDRMRAEYDYKVNLKTELDVRVLNEKMDRLLFHQWQRLLDIQEIQTDFMEELVQRRQSGP
jgi:uncharacterized membrane protein